MNTEDRLAQFFLFFLLIGLCKASAHNLSTVGNSTQDFQTSVEIHKNRNKKGPKRSSTFSGNSTTWEWPKENEKDFKTIRHREPKPPSAKTDFESRIASLKPIDEESTEAESDTEGPKNPFKNAEKSSSSRTVFNNHIQKSLISNMNHYPFEAFDHKKNTSTANQTLSVSESKYQDRLEFYKNASIPSRSTLNSASSISTYSSLRKYQSTGPLVHEIRKQLEEKALSDSETNVSDLKKDELANLKERIISGYQNPKVLEPKKFRNEVKIEPEGNIPVNKPLNYYLVDNGKSWPTVYQFPDCKLTIY